MGGSESVPEIPGDLPPVPGELPDIQNITLPNPEDLEIFQDVDLDDFDLELPEPPDIELTFEDFIGEELPSDLGAFLEDTLEVAIEIGAIEPNVTFNADCICHTTDNAAVFNISEIFAQFCPNAQDALDSTEDEVDELDDLDLEVTCENDELPEELSCGDILQLEVIFSNEIEGPCVEPGEDSLLSGFASVFNITEFSELLEERCCSDVPPSAAPTPLLSASPTTALQPMTSAAPSLDPTFSPSGSPTLSFEPTSDPTFSPSSGPSLFTSSAPTGSPTPFPTPAPSSLPTFAPSALPSEAPSFSDQITMSVEVEIDDMSEEEFDDPDVHNAFRKAIAGIFDGVDEDDVIITGFRNQTPARRLSRTFRQLQGGLVVEFELVARVSEVEVDGVALDSNNALFEAMSNKIAEAADSGEMDTALQDESDAFDGASVNADSVDITASGGVSRDGGGGGGGDGTVLIIGVAVGVAGVFIVGGILSWYYFTNTAVSPGSGNAVTKGSQEEEGVAVAVPYNS